MDQQLTPCPDCKAMLPPSDGPVHRYLGASAACWALFAALNNGGEPPLAPAPANALLTDAYAAQHYGLPSPQAVQSVAVHLLALYGVLEAGLPLDRAVWVRAHVLTSGDTPKRERFVWLDPPDFTGALTVADIVQQPTPEERTDLLGRYVKQVWQRWSQRHGKTVAAWYEQYGTA